MTDRAKLYAFAAACCVAAAITGCVQPPRERVTGIYAHDSRALLRLDHDYDGDGRIDVRTYMRDGRPVRLEGDGDGDGLIDRWEYYGRGGELVSIGGSSQADGQEDMWVRTRNDGRTVEMSTMRDGRVDRREVYRGDALVRAESDTNHDGLPDRWEEYRNGAVVRLLLDDERRLGRPTRRIVYEGQQVPRVEMDLDGDGTWEVTGQS